MPYMSKTSGHLRGGGGNKRSKSRMRVISGKPLKNIPDVHISDTWSIKHLIPDFDPMLEFDYTRRELMLLAEKILLTDTKPATEYPAWINSSKYLTRIRPREIFTGAGTPDPAIASGLYWRSHPEGRRVSSDEQRRKTGASYYR